MISDIFMFETKVFSGFGFNEITINNKRRFVHSDNLVFNLDLLKSAVALEGGTLEEAKKNILEDVDLFEFALFENEESLISEIRKVIQEEIDRQEGS